MNIDRKKLDEVFERIIAKANRGAVSAVMFDAEGILYEKHDGYLDRRKKIRPASDSLFMIGSNTKVMTTLGILRLWEDGKLDVHDDIRKYIPEFSVKSRMGDYPFTIEDFMMHRTGLVCDMYRYLIHGSHEYGEIVEGLKDTYRTALPTEMFSYSNLGFTLLGILIERVSGMSYAAFMRKNLFEPLDMEVYFGQERELPEQVRSRIARSYDAEGVQKQDLLGCCIPAGACTYTAVYDLVKIGQLLMNKGKYGRKRLYKKKTIDWMEQLPIRDELDRELSYIGHSLYQHKRLSSYETGPFMGHGGATIYHYSVFDFLPEEKIGVIIFSSFATAYPLILKTEIALFDEYLRQAGYRKKEESSRKPIKTDITRFVGKYDTSYGTMSFFLSDEGRLCFRLQGSEARTRITEGNWIRIIPQGKKKDMPADMKVISRAYLKQAVYFGRSVLVMDNGITESVIGCRYTEPAVNDMWLKALGSYRAAEGLPKDIYKGMKLALYEGELQLTITIIDEELKYYLHVLNDEEAVVKGFGRNAGQTVTLKRDGGSLVLECDGLKAKKRL